MREINRDVISVFLLAIVLLVLLSGQASANSVWTEYYHDNKNTGRGANAFYVEPSLEIEALDVINAQPGGKFTLTPTIRNTVVTAEGSTVNVSTNASVFGRDINNDTFVGNLLGNGSSKSAAYNITVPLTVGEHQINISANRINRDLNKPNDKTVMASAGFLSGWNYRKQKTINGTSAGAQTNYQMNLTLYNSTGNDTSGAVYLGGNTRSDFGDLRFTKSDGVTLLDYWIESYTSGTNATVWIEVDSIPASPNNTSIYLYYDNPSAISASNGTATFPFFDDFNTRSSIDTNKWTVNQGDQYISGGILVLATYDRTYIRSIQTFGVNTCVRTRVKIDTDAYDTGGDKGYVGYADGTGRPIADPYQDYTVLDWSTYANLGSLMFDTAVDSSHRAEPVFGSTSSNPRTTFVIDELRRLTSTVYVYENDSQLYAYSTAANIPTNAMPVVMGSAIWSTYYDGVVGSAQYDWILVRNFVSPEPTWALPTSTQTFAPSGYVFNNMGAGISGATVTIYNGTYANSVLTNGTGYYSMTLPADGTYTYVAAKDGYLNSTPTSQTFTNGGSTLTNITLDPSTSILLYSDFYSTDLANPTNIMKDSKVHFYYSTAPNANLSLKVEGPVPQVITDKADYTGSAEIDVNFPATGSYTVFIDKVNDQTTPTPQKYFFKATYDRFDLSIGFTPQVTVSGDTGTVGGSIGESAPRSISMRYNGDGTFTNQDILGTDAGLETSREVTAVVNVGPPSAALGPLTVGSADIGENVHINEGHGYGFKTISNDLTRADLYYGTGILVVPDLLNPIEPVYYEPIIGNLLQNPIKPYAEFNKIGVGLSGEGEAYFGMPYDKVGIKGSAGVGIEGSDNFADQKREISLYSPWEFGSSVLAWDNTTGGEVRSTAVYNFNGEFDSLKLSKSDTSTHITGTPETLFLGGIGKEADSETGYTIPSSEISKVSGTVTQNFVNSQTNIEDITLSPQTMLDEISASPIKSTYEKSGITGDSNILELPLKIKAIAGGGIDIRLTTDLLKEKLYESGITTDKIPEGWIAYPIIENPHKDYDLHNLSYKYLSVLFDKTQIENAISSKFRNLNITGKLLNATIVEFSELLGQHDLHIQVVDQYGRIVGFNSTTNSSSNNIPGALILQNSTIDNVTYKEVIIVPADLGITAFMDARQAENLTETYNLSISQFDNSTNSSAQTTVVGNITQGTLLKFKIHASNESLPSGYLNALP
ncbi:MAG: DUF2341 domain-containing protein, partial [Candidatus Methanoperedens sp.]|nr:DUF2341 domain-containing protein [Candidatus Methanoperedens sp.]